jgi:hypothetical protein
MTSGIVRHARALVLAFSLLPAGSVALACVGDCDGDRSVTVDEILTLVTLGLDEGVLGCQAGDVNGDQQITVDEIVRALNLALSGCPQEFARIAIGTVQGAPGGTVVVEPVLAGGESRLYAASIDLLYDAGHVRVARDSGGPDCTVAPAIGAGTPSDKRLLLALLPQDNGRELLRVGIISFTSIVALPDGPLFSCRFTIDEDAPPGVVDLGGVADGSDPSGSSIAVDAIAGRIIVGD